MLPLGAGEGRCTPVVCWRVLAIWPLLPTRGDREGPRFSVRGWATRLRRPRLSFRRCTVMVPGRGEGWTRCDVLLGNCQLMAAVNLPPSQLLSLESALGTGLTQILLWNEPEPGSLPEMALG